MAVEAFSSTIDGLFALTPIGPFEGRRTLFTIPAPWNNIHGGVFCYAPKYHSELSTSDSASEEEQWVLSFMSNTFELSELLNMTSVYVPQFVRIKLAM